MPVLVFANLKGGVGKTTNAVAVAEALADTGREVLVIDADHQCAASELLLGKKRFHECERLQLTLHDLLAAMLQPDFVVEQFDAYCKRQVSSIGGGLPTLSVVPCSLRIDDFSTNRARAGNGYHSTEEFDGFLRQRRALLRRWLSARFHYTIVDCPPSVPLQVRMLLRVADAYIMPSIPDELSVRGSFQFLERLRRLGTEVQPLGTLWSMYRANNELHTRTIERARKQDSRDSLLPRPFRTIIPNATAIARAGEPDRNYASFSAKYEVPFARLFQGLCSEIDSRWRVASRIPAAAEI